MSLLLTLAALLVPPSIPAPADGWSATVQPAVTIAHHIAQCESGGDPLAQNPTSSASGLYQFIDGTWEWVTGLSAPASSHPVRVQTLAFWQLWDGGRGASHWVESRHCWGVHA